MGRPKTGKCAGGSYCSAPGCRSCTAREGRQGVKFFRFPKEPDKRQVWIDRIGRTNKDGSPWTPPGNARLCSMHFRSGNHSNDPQNPDYAPTIFIKSKRKKYERSQVVDDGEEDEAAHLLGEQDGQEAQHDMDEALRPPDEEEFNPAIIKEEVFFEADDDEDSPAEAGNNKEAFDGGEPLEPDQSSPVSAEVGNNEDASLDMARIRNKNGKWRGGYYCAATDCHSCAYREGQQGVKFFRFPNDPDRLKLWIDRMGRTKPDGSPWTPGYNARLCSKHFISGKHSKYPFHEDYAPSIFPTSTDSRKRRHDGSNGNRLLVVSDDAPTDGKDFDGSSTDTASSDEFEETEDNVSIQGDLPIPNTSSAQSSLSSASVRKYGGPNCCVVGCENSLYKESVITKGIKLYRFPAASKFPQRRELWIHRVNRKNKDGSRWMPSKSEFISKSLDFVTKLYFCVDVYRFTVMLGALYLGGEGGRPRQP